LWIGPVDSMDQSQLNKPDMSLELLERLKVRYPKPLSALNWKNPWQLLVATVLSAQCTDKQVNKVTPEFFSFWPDAASLSRADPEQVQKVIRPTGFFRAKASNLTKTAYIVANKFSGQVPASMDELLSLPGVARKTANIVLFNAFGLNQGIAVDTHVRRLSLRLGLTDSSNTTVIERDLMALFPRQHWGEINHFMVLFGREICRARKPFCSACFLIDICPSRQI